MTATRFTAYITTADCVCMNEFACELNSSHQGFAQTQRGTNLVIDHGNGIVLMRPIQSVSVLKTVMRKWILM